MCTEVNVINCKKKLSEVSKINSKTIKINCNQNQPFYKICLTTNAMFRALTMESHTQKSQIKTYE